MVEQLRKCRKCQKDYPYTQLKYFNDTVNLYCPACIAEKRNTGKKPELKTVASTPSVKPATPGYKSEPAHVRTDDLDKRIKYKCYKCGYVFVQTKTYERGCPYCGSAKVLTQEVTNNVDKLILESSQSKYDQ